MLERIQVLGVAGAIAALAVLAGCGSGGSSSTESTAAGAGTGGGGAGGATISVSDNAELGKILVDSRGMTLYLFEKDDEADESYCNGACAKQWPPLRTTGGAPQAGPGVTGKLTTFKRDDGTTQVAYDGHPLYHFAGDASPGDVNGNGSTAFGAEWYAVTPDGKPAEGAKGTEGGSSTTTGSGYSY